MLKRKRYTDDEDSNDDVNIYSKSARELLLDDDEISPSEEAFMDGYGEAI